MDDYEKEIRRLCDLAKSKAVTLAVWNTEAIINLLAIIDRQRAEMDAKDRKYTQTVARWQVRAERAEAGEAEEIQRRLDPKPHNPPKPKRVKKHQRPPGFIDEYDEQW